MEVSVCVISMLNHPLSISKITSYPSMALSSDDMTVCEENCIKRMVDGTIVQDSCSTRAPDCFAAGASCARARTGHA